jgi:hypothetical protein
MWIGGERLISRGGNILRGKMSTQIGGEKVPVNPAAGVNAASAGLPFGYKDVARQIVENAWVVDSRGWWNWQPIVIYYSKEKGLFAAEPGARVEGHAVKIYELKPNEDRQLPGRDYSTRYSNGYDDFDDDDDGGFGGMYSLSDELLEAKAYARQTIEPYLVKKMERQNLAAKWAALIQEAAKSE